MNQGNRVLTPHNIQELSARLVQDRKDLLNHFEKSMGETMKFAQAAATAVGDISYNEAVKGIIDFFTEEMRKKT